MAPRWHTFPMHGRYVFDVVVVIVISGLFFPFLLIYMYSIHVNFF